MTIIPIAMSKLDWGIFVRTAERFIGYSPSRILDAHNLETINPESFLYSLASFRDQEYDTKKFLTDTLSHVYISFFMVVSDKVYTEFLERNNHLITFIRSEESKVKSEIVVIATGDLYAWKNICTTFNNNFESRELSYRIYEILIGIGYKNLFNDFKITENIDGSKILQRR